VKRPILPEFERAVEGIVPPTDGWWACTCGGRSFFPAVVNEAGRRETWLGWIKAHSGDGHKVRPEGGNA
jgi:hypothetical protein